MKNIDIMRGASRMVRELAEVQSDESVLVVTDTFSLRFGEAIAAAANEVAKEVSLVVITTYGYRHRHGQDPAKCICEAIRNADVVFMSTEWSLFHSNARREANKAGVRCISTAQPDDEMYCRTIPESPFKEAIEVLQRVNGFLIPAEECYIKARGGTDLYLSLKGRTYVETNNIYATKKNGYVYASPPCVEANIAPVEGSAQGKLVIDACQASIGLITDPIEVIIKDGVMREIRGGIQARNFRSFLENSGEPLLYHVCELGIGLNPACRVRGRFVEDEACYGTAHLGCGDNFTSWGGNIRAKAHTDSIFWRPTITLDGKTIMKEGKLQVPGVPDSFKGYYE
jgi:leucyl aminopeptidase (aminopeptidase T)